jgi:hypothetical protein
MKIALIELDFHVDSVDGICKVFEDSVHHLFIFTTEDNIRILSQRSYFKKHEWFSLKKWSKTEFLKQQSEQINSCDGVFINTISSDFKVFAQFNFKPLTILRVHNAYKMFAPFSHIKIYPNPKGIFKALSYFVREVVLDAFWYYRPQVVKKMDYFTFPDQAIVDYLMSRQLIPSDKIAPVFPIKVLDEKVLPMNIIIPGEVHITIPGGVDKRRRDYEPVVDALRKTIGRSPVKIFLYLLGKCNGAYGRKVVQELRALENDKFSVVYFSDFVSQHDFDEIMRKTNLVISPVNPDALTQLYGEIYGKTKISGSITDIVLFPKPLIMPQSYALNEHWKKVFFTYENSEDLSNIILDLVHKPDEITKRTIEVFRTAGFLCDKKMILNSMIEFYSSAKKKYSFKNPAVS